MLVRLLSFLLFFLPALALAQDPVIGMYGVSMPTAIVSGGEAANLKNNGVNAVFVPPDRKTIEYFTAQNLKVNLTLNVFGGREPWEEFPDSIPVTADGTQLSDSYGGICPTHSEWRQKRLKLLEQWLEEFGGDQGISGIWLDFIRYPGRWEHPEPLLPDSCYCSRCLTLFQAVKGVQFPSGLSTAESAGWIRTNAHIKWVDWKKEQIVSFVRDARRLVDQYSKERELLLGAFLVPWKKSDQNGAVSFRLAQDSQLLAPYLDVLSPMVYHKMVGEPVSWIGETTDYFAETGVPVWPIIQAEDVGKDELAQVIQGLNESKSDGMLVYTYRHMTDDQWPLLNDFEGKGNLIPNPQLIKDESIDDVKKEGEVGTPRDWAKPPSSSVQDSTYWFDRLDSKNKNAIGLTGGQDRKASWTTELQGCEPGEKYQFSAEFYRRDRSDPQAYPEISIWGESYRLNTHRIADHWQKLKARMVCPEGVLEKGTIFEFKNSYPGTTFWMRSPELTRVKKSDLGLFREPVKTNFFPIGAYGANSKNLGEFKKVGLNTAVVSMTQDNIEKCLELNMRCTLSVPRTPEKLFVALEKFSPLLELGNFSYYVNDEPGIHSFSESTARDIYDIIKAHLPNAVV